jgi:recombination protein RecA
MREVLRRRISDGGNYFAAGQTDVEFFSSGCTVFDLALGGGWAEKRIANIVGDKSTGKTLLCIEAAANFAMKYPKSKIRYRECEAAFQPQYAAALGLPIKQVDFGAEQLQTVEDFFEDISAVIAKAKGPELYIIDSLDALSDKAELERDIDEGSYGAQKAKKLSELFRRTVRALAHSNITVIIVSQVRDKIGQSFGRQSARSGGRALDFYASQVVWLSQLGRLSKTIEKIKRPVGIRIKAALDKNKIALPFREANFSLVFGWGIDDTRACLDYLNECGRLGSVNMTERDINKVSQRLMRERDDVLMRKLQSATRANWYEIEKGFLPQRRKYDVDAGS